MIKLVKTAFLTTCILIQTCIATEKAAGRKVVDRIIAFVDGAKILKSDLDKPRIAKDGKPFTLNEIILEAIMVKRASERHILPSEADVERQIVAFKIQNNIGDIPDDEFEKQLNGYGFTLKMYREQLSFLLASENLKRMEIGDKIVVTSQEVENYYNQNPIFSPEEYNLKMLPKTNSNEDESISLGWIKKDDLDKKFHFVFKMKKGETSKTPVKISNKEYFVSLVDYNESKKLTLSQRYGDIEKFLTKEKIDHELKGFEKKILAEATVEMVEEI